MPVTVTVQVLQYMRVTMYIKEVSFTEFLIFIF